MEMKISNGEFSKISFLFQKKKKNRIFEGHLDRHPDAWP